MVFEYFISYLGHSGKEIVCIIDPKRQEIFSTELSMTEKWKTNVRP